MAKGRRPIQSEAQRQSKGLYEMGTIPGAFYDTVTAKELSVILVEAAMGCIVCLNKKIDAASRTEFAFRRSVCRW